MSRIFPIPRPPRRTQALRLLALVGLALLLAACSDDAAQRQAAESAAAARAEAAAMQMLRNLEESEAAGRPDLARAFAEDLVGRFPHTTAGVRAAERLPAIRLAAEAGLEARRLEGLWTYHEVEDAAAGGAVRTAFIYGQPVEGELPPLRLVLRRHPAWGQSAYLLVAESDFACQDECQAELSVDSGDAQRVLISRAKGVVPPALFIERDADFLAALSSARELVLGLALADGRQARYRFEVAGFELGRLGPVIAVP